MTDIWSWASSGIVGQYIVPGFFTVTGGIFVAWFANRSNIRAALIKAQSELDGQTLTNNKDAWASLAEYLKAEKENADADRKAAEERERRCEERYDQLNSRFMKMEAVMIQAHPELFTQLLPTKGLNDVIS